MAVLPFYYVYGKTLLNTHFMVGGSVVINNRFAFPNSVVKDMAEKEVTGFAGVPSTFAILLNRSVFSQDAGPEPQVHHPGRRGHGPCADQAAHRLSRAMSPCTSCTVPRKPRPRLTYLPPERLVKDKLGSIGIPIPGVEITIRDDGGNDPRAG